MAEIVVRPLPPTIDLRVGAPYLPPAGLMERIDEIWTVEKRQRGEALTNGRLYCLGDVAADHLLIHPTEYRYLLARRRAPELVGAGLDLRTLAVTGIVTCESGVVLGQRGRQLAVDGGLWEPAPAGGLAQPDPVRQVLEEAEEELGLSPDQFGSPLLCGLVEDVASGVTDFVFHLPARTRAAEIHRRHAEWATDEYQRLEIVPLHRLLQFLRDQQDSLLPALRPMLAMAGLLPE